jgi:hypothetical protein
MKTSFWARGIVVVRGGSEEASRKESAWGHFTGIDAQTARASAEAQSLIGLDLEFLLEEQSYAGRQGTVGGQRGRLRFGHNRAAEVRAISSEIAPPGEKQNVTIFSLYNPGT